MMQQSLRCIKQTKGHGPMYVAGTKHPNTIKFFADANHAACKVTGRSTGCTVGFINGAPYYWGSKLHPGRPARSTEESEFNELLRAGLQAVTDRYFLNEIGYPQEEPTIILNDNQQAITLATTGRLTPANRHIDTKGHILRYLQRNGDIDIRWIPTKANIADVGTKVMQDPDMFEMFQGCLVKPKPRLEPLGGTNELTN